MSLAPEAKIATEVLSSAPVKKISDTILLINAAFPIPFIGGPIQTAIQYATFIVVLILLIAYFKVGWGGGLVFSYLTMVLIGYLYSIGFREGIFYVAKKIV